MYQTIFLPSFQREIKPCLKKHPDLKEALIDLVENFDTRQHDALGHGLYKARLRCQSIGKGKSKSFRLIVLIIEVENFLVPMILYFKGDQAAIQKKELRERLANTLWELQIRGYLQK